jgi:predicted SprT family Zn-dependent metalloprotease
MINTQSILNYRQRVQENLDLFISIADDNGYPVPRPTMRYKANMTRAAGTCSSKEITLSVDYLAEFEDEQVWNTLGHEFAHWIQFNHPHMFTFTRRKRIAHNDKFYALCRMLGVKDSRCHSMHLQNVTRRTTKVHSVSCLCRTHKVTKAMQTKIANGSGHYCRKCKSTLVVGELAAVG